ncbi:MAG TPA: enoyl-CoA-hydratase DpgB [Amycolatopsis sp.]|uniref:enoyl-CoA-hydratase DpgB n=1 Tax=Amycolatopsis sp. TaxID=37632 RepID=UPI002B45E951|nr:enoyl-CoA-hydratase DpgB [Amycolatopsis sp.]HKS43666.1 enoyl-CoA-hydratase DpgB [Amycolatopsis sp.]
MSWNGALNEGLTLRIDGTVPLSIDAVKAVEELCAHTEAHDGTGAVPIRMSGAPVTSWTGGADVALVSKWERAVRRLERLGAITVAVAEGDLGGLALDVLLATDYRIAAPDTRLVVPVEDGVSWPGMATYRLARQAGIAAVRRAVLFGHPIEAGEAVTLSLLHEVAEDPAALLAEVTEELAAVPGRELAIRRQLIHDAVATSFEDALGVHLAACDRALRRSSPGVVS